MNRETILAEMAERQLDALVAVSMENVYYSSEALILTQRLIPERLAFVVWTADGGATAIVCSIEEPQVRTDSWIDDVRGYTEFKDSPTAVLADLLREKGLDRGRVGLETLAMSARAEAELRAHLPSADLLDGDQVFEKARMIKSPDEIERLSTGARITDEAIRVAFSSAAVGDTEAATADRMTRELRSGGADGVAFVVLTTGANSRLAHPIPSSLAIAAQDVVRTDVGGYFGAYVGGYLSDLARTAVAGRPTPEQRSTYARLFEVHELLLRAIRPGVRACDIYELCRQSFEARRLDFQSPHVGHSIGLSVHEFPMLNPYTTQELLPGMVLAIEPIHRGGDGRYHVEDMVVVTNSGSRTLSPVSSWSELMTIGQA